MQTIVVSPEQIQQLRNMGMVFSCNHHRDVWPDCSKSFHRKDMRWYVQGRNTLLDHIVHAYLTIRPSGGRFKLIGNEVYRADTNAVFLRLETRVVLLAS